MNRGDVCACGCTSINTPQFKRWVFAVACHKHCHMQVHTRADTCSEHGVQVAYRRERPLLCILLWLLQDIEVNRRRVATCSSALHVSNSHNCFRLDPTFTFSSQSFSSRQSSLHPGSQCRAQQPISLTLSAWPQWPQVTCISLYYSTISCHWFAVRLPTTMNTTIYRSLCTCLCHKIALCNS